MERDNNSIRLNFKVKGRIIPTNTWVKGLKGEGSMSKITDYFKDMDEVRKYVESLKETQTEEDYELFLYLFGLLDNRGISEPVEIEGKSIQIDKFLVPYIKDLNQMGIKTLACCSALQAEHPEDKYKPESGYLSFALDRDVLKKLQDIISDSIIVIKESDCYLQPCITITIKSKEDSVLKEKWVYVFKILKEIYKNK